MHNFKEHKIWMDSMDIVEDIYKITNNFPGSEKFGLINQMRRCAVSIPSNIAEGSGRSDKDFCRFLSMSLSSSFELETQLIISKRLELIDENNFENILGKVSKLQKMIFGFKKKISE
ncbi:MAG: four helix bundle protein [Bacteroidetes bacterium]|nr:four helix bundle protein [Bacteroidota bacterium]